MIDQNTLAYCAGILDGEGSIYFQKRKYDTVPEIAIGITHEPTTSLFQQLFGGSIWIKIYDNPNHNTKYTWKVSSRKACAAALALISYSNLKKPKLQKILDHYEVKRPRIRLPTTAYFAGLIDAEGYVGLLRQSTRAAKTRPPNVPFIRVEMTDKFMVKSLQEFFKCGSVHGSTRAQRRVSHHKPTWIWTATFNAAREVSTKIVPYGVIKKEKLQTIINLPKLHRGPQGKLSAGQVREIRQRRENGENCQTIAVDFNVHATFISQIYLRKWYAHIK